MRRQVRPADGAKPPGQGFFLRAAIAEAFLRHVGQARQVESTSQKPPSSDQRAKIISLRPAERHAWMHAPALRSVRAQSCHGVGQLQTAEAITGS